MSALAPATLLSVWEHGLARHPLDRALLLLTLACPDVPAARLADIPLGQRNLCLLRLRERLFGNALELVVDCPACGERMAFPFAPAGVCDVAPCPDREIAPIEVGGLHFALPNTRHLAQLVTLEDTHPYTAARALLRACALAPEALPDDAALDALIAEVEARLSEADPWAEIAVDVACPACGHPDTALFDPGAALWDALDAAAQRLLDDVHLLAARYGWSEAEILALGPARRNAYLARVLA